MARAVGIDLGTTNSCVAVLEAGIPVVVPNAEGGRTTPSVVAYSRTGDVLVGDVAKRQAVTNTDRTVRSVKRRMGTAWTKQIDYSAFTPQQMSALILMKLKADTETYLHQDVSDAVITVPAYFSDAQRQATKEAGELAGLNVVRIVNEPTAAALAYGLGQADDEQTVLVYDLGGGTFDVSLLDIADGVVEVRATSGDNALGGDDWDARLVDWLKKRFYDTYGLDLSDDDVAMQRISEAAERAKIELSTTAQATVRLPYLYATPEDGALHFEAVISRTEFQRITADLLERTKVPFGQVIADAGVNVEDIDHVILVGGSTRMPAVVTLVKELTGGREPRRDVNPDEVVAMGAALQAGVLTGEVKDILLLDVTPLTLGIETKGGVMRKMIARNTTIPTKRTETFTTAVDNQSTVSIHVYQGEREMAAQNQYLGDFALTGLPAAARGVPQIDVTFDIDANGIVHVTAVDTETGLAQSITISAAAALSQEEIEEMVDSAARNAEADRLLKETAETRVNVEAAAHTVERMLAEHAADLPAQVIADARERVAAARAAIDGDDTLTMAAAMGAVEDITRTVAGLLGQADAQATPVDALLDDDDPDDGVSSPQPEGTSPATGTAD